MDQNKKYQKRADSHNLYVCLLIAVFSVTWCQSSTCYGGWLKKDVGFSFSELSRVVIGDGRNDGTMRVYTGDNNGRAHEFSFSEGSWQKSTFGDASGVKGIGIGSVRKDGTRRVYLAGYNVYECSRNGNSWTNLPIGPYVQWTNDIAIGKGRNDWRSRIYVALWDGIMELTYNNGSWASRDIDTGGESMGRILVLDGRNDGVLRLYASTDWSDHVYEFTWSDTGWQVVDCGQSGAIAFQDMAAGKGRNDGLNRIYLAGLDGAVYELSYGKNGWKYSLVANPAPLGNVGVVALGKGRNDKLNRIYAFYSPSYSSHEIAEFAYNKVTKTWKKSSSLSTSVVANDITVGPGRNDGNNHVYVAARDNHLYEFRYDPTK